MPFKSRSQQRYFYANRKKLEAQGVDLKEWSDSTNFKKLPEKVSMRKQSFHFPDADEREFNRSGFRPMKHLGGMLMGGPILGVIPPMGLTSGADQVSGGGNYANLSEAGRARVMQARDASGFGTALKGGLPMTIGAVAGGGIGAALGGMDGAIPGAVAGTLAGTIPSYYYSKHLGRTNAEEALGKGAGLGTVFGGLRAKFAFPQIPQNALIAADVAGLGILAEPTIHKWVSGPDAVSETEKDLTEVGGLGLLAATQIPHLTGHVAENHPKVAEFWATEYTKLSAAPVVGIPGARRVPNPGVTSLLNPSLTHF